jgi:preprotein translocase subunit YajC
MTLGPPLDAIDLTLVLAQDQPLPSGAPVAGANGQPATTGTAPADPGAAGGGAQQPPPASPFGGQFLFLMLGLMVFMIVMSMMQGRKEKKRRAAMLASLGKHDRVMTSSGIIGVITEMRDDEIVLKVDEANNTRIHFARSAVSQVLKSASQADSAAA